MHGGERTLMLHPAALCAFVRGLKGWHSEQNRVHLQSESQCVDEVSNAQPPTSTPPPPPQVGRLRASILQACPAACRPQIPVW